MHTGCDKDITAKVVRAGKALMPIDIHLMEVPMLHHICQPHPRRPMGPAPQTTSTHPCMLPEAYHCLGQRIIKARLDQANCDEIRQSHLLADLHLGAHSLRVTGASLLAARMLWEWYMDIRSILEAATKSRGRESTTLDRFRHRTAPTEA